VGNAFDDDGIPLDEAYDKRIIKFLDEYEWYANALKRARNQEKIDLEPPAQQQMCRGNER
jgi:hypothetical protein